MNSVEHDEQTNSNWNSKTLGALSCEFIRMIASNNGIIDLKQFHERTNISKRRIYDITNTLEGFGIITRVQKNIYKLEKQHLTSFLQQKNLLYNISDTMINTNNDSFEDEENEEEKDAKLQLNQLAKQCEEKNQLLEQLKQANEHFLIDHKNSLYVDFQTIYDCETFHDDIALSIYMPQNTVESSYADKDYSYIQYSNTENSLYPELYTSTDMRISMYTSDSTTPFSPNKEFHSVLAPSYIAYANRCLLLGDSDGEENYSLSSLFLDQ